MRYCPKCNSELSSNDHYYCTNCGFVLPDSLRYAEVPIKTRVLRPDYFNNRVYKSAQKLGSSGLGFLINRHTIKYYLAAVVLIVFGIFAGNIVSLLFSTITTQSKLNEASQRQQTGPSGGQFIESSLAFSSGAVYPNSMANYVPQKVDLYILIPDAKSASSYIAREMGTDPIQTSAYASLLNGPIAIFSMSGDHALVATVKERDLVSAILKDKSVKDLKIKLVGDVLIITNTDAMLKAVEDTINGHSLNLGQNPEYINLKSKLPVEGKMLIITFTDAGKVILTELKDQIKDNQVSSTLEQVLRSGYNELVIK